KQKSADVALVVQWGIALADDLETSSMDDLKFTLRSFFKMKDGVSLSKQTEVLEAENFVKAESEILADLFIELGAILQKDQSVSNTAEDQEILIEVSGIQSFMQMTRVKNQIQSLLNGRAIVEERRMS